jgi:hypothetical protein
MVVWSPTRLNSGLEEVILMAKAGDGPVRGTKPYLTPETFLEKMEVPTAPYRTAIAIKHQGRMNQVMVAFVLQAHDDQSATYSAVCPRCQIGAIVVVVKLNVDGSLAEAPACPTLCLACEDRLDAIIDPQAWVGLKVEPSDRETLSMQIKAMKTRA